MTAASGRSHTRPRGGDFSEKKLFSIFPLHPGARRPKSSTGLDLRPKDRPKSPFSHAKNPVDGIVEVDMLGGKWGFVVLRGEIMHLTGTFSRSVDEKLRIAIPKRLREALGSVGGAVLYIAPGTDGSLTLYTEEAFSELADRLAKSPPTGEDVRAYSRLFFAQAERLSIDRQGRIRIPPQLATLASLNREAVLLGVRDHLELWDRGRWEKYRAEKLARYDEIAESAFGAPNTKGTSS